MNKKLILLMLALPLILMLCLFTATSTVSLAISVHVTGVEINDDDVVYIDLEKPYDVEYTVYPTNAANKNVSFSAEPVGSDTFATLTFEDGKIVPQSCGKAKVYVTTADGGYKDSFIVVVSTDKLQAIDSTISSETLKIGETAKISTSFTPASASLNELGYEIITGKEVVEVDGGGAVKGIALGEATIKIYCLINPDVCAEVCVTVERTAPIEFASKTDTKRLSQTEGEIALLTDDTVVGCTTSLQVLDEDGNALDVFSEYKIEDGTFKYAFKEDEEFIGKVVVQLTVTWAEGTATDYLTITRIDKMEAKWADEDWADANQQIIVLEINSGGDPIYPSEARIEIMLLPSDADVSYEVSLSNDLVSCTIDNGCLVVTAKKAGATYAESYTIITLTITDNSTGETVELTRKVNVYTTEFSG